MGKQKKKNSNYITKQTEAKRAEDALLRKKRKNKKAFTAAIITVAAIIVIFAVVLLIAAPWKKTGQYVKMEVENYGDVILFIDSEAAPITADNFLSLVNSGFYDGLTFHRVIEGFMIQGGDPKANGSGSSDKTIYGEFKENGYDNPIAHKKGVISMARGDSPDSASCQFFICNATNANVSLSLDGKYAAFGYVVEGLDIIDRITADSLEYTGYNGMIYSKDDQVVIKSMSVLDSYG